MDKILLKDESKKSYQEMIAAAQQLESALGSAEYKIFKMKRQREMLDGELKKWWDNVVAEYRLDMSKDYFVDAEGCINIVEKPKVPTTKPVNVPKGDVVEASLVGKTVEDLK